MPVTKGHGNPKWSREETILALDLVLREYPRVPGKESTEVHALSDLIRSLPIHASGSKNPQFRNAAGVYMKLQNLLSLHPDKAERKGLRTSETDRAIWNEYAGKPEVVAKLAQSIADGVSIMSDPDTSEPDDNDSVSEGSTLYRRHRLRERNRSLRRRVLERVRAEHAGVLQCEACELRSPKPSPAEIEASIFEVHHLLPLAHGVKTMTRLRDLALLCANCHRLIHAAMRDELSVLTLDEFRTWQRRPV